MTGSPNFGVFSSFNSTHHCFCTITTDGKTVEKANNIQYYYENSLDLVNPHSSVGNTLRFRGPHFKVHCFKGTEVHFTQLGRMQGGFVEGVRPGLRPHGYLCKGRVGCLDKGNSKSKGTWWEQQVSLPQFW